MTVETSIVLSEHDLRQIQLDRGFYIASREAVHATSFVRLSRGVIAECDFNVEVPLEKARFTATVRDEEGIRRVHIYYGLDRHDDRFDVVPFTHKNILFLMEYIPTKNLEDYTSAEIGHVNTVMENPREHAPTLTHWMRQLHADNRQEFSLIPQGGSGLE